MGIGSVVIQNGVVSMSSLNDCNKEGSPITDVIKPSVCHRPSIAFDTMNTCVSGTRFLFRLQGEFVEDEQHPCPAESSADVDP